MKYFLDTEFIEYPCTIDLISIGIVSEDGREFYAESNEVNWGMANEWVKSHVKQQLWHIQSDKREFNAWSRDGGQGGIWSRGEIARGVRRFVDEDLKPEFWGYYADYDWVAFCWLFGPMIDLPKRFPMYCRDIKQWCDELGNPELPKQASTEHNALDDARHNKLMWEFLNELSPLKG